MARRTSPIAVGVALAAIAAVAFGVTTPVVAWAGRGLGPFATAALLYAGAAVASLAIRGSCGEWPRWPVGLLVFLAGQEYRIRIEDNLLRGRFGERFETWKRQIPAYIPFVR